MDAAKTGALIAQARKEKDLTQGQLAQRLHVSVQAVSKWERGRNFPDLALLEPLAEALDLTVSELLAGERGETPQESTVREALALGAAQLKKQMVRWRGAVACLLLIALFFGLIRGYVWVRDHTELLPQGESWVTPRSLDQESQSLLQATGGSAYAFDVALADDNEGYKLQLELWTEEGMEACWPILEGAGRSPSRHGRLNLFVFLNFNPPEDTTMTCGLSFEGLRVYPFTVETPYLRSGCWDRPLQGRSQVNREEGIALVCFGLEGDDGRFRIPASVWGQYDLPPRDGAVLLLLKLYVL